MKLFSPIRRIAGFILMQASALLEKLGAYRSSAFLDNIGLDLSAKEIPMTAEEKADWDRRVEAEIEAVRRPFERALSKLTPDEHGAVIEHLGGPASGFAPRKKDWLLKSAAGRLNEHQRYRLRLSAYSDEDVLAARTLEAELDRLPEGRDSRKSEMEP